MWARHFPVTNIVERDLPLKCLKKRKAHELTEVNMQAILPLLLTTGNDAKFRSTIKSERQLINSKYFPCIETASSNYYIQPFSKIGQGVVQLLSLI